MNAITTVGILIILVIGLCLALYTYASNLKEEFATKMAMADAQSKMTTTKSFNELKEILNYIIVFICTNEISLIGNSSVSTDEVMSTIETYVADISAKCYNFLSVEFKRQFCTYVDEEFLLYYIRKSTLINVTNMINSRTTKSINRSKS